MILGIGSDTSNIERIEKALNKHGEKFIKRCFFGEELVKAEMRKKNKANYISHFAKRWAAKEAFVKAIGTGFSNGVFLKDIEIVNDEWGKPSIKLHNGAKKMFERLIPKGYSANIHLTISDDYPTANAHVIIDAERQ